MGDAYWRYNDARQQQQQPAVDLPSYLAKRPRPEYEVPSGQDMSSYYARDDGRGGLRVMGGSESINASYDRYLRTTQSSSYGGDSGHSIGGQQFGDRRVVSIGGSDATVTARSRSAGVPSRPEIQLPSDASNTLYVECLPANCTRREVSHIFRPFLGYKEVRLVTKESRHSGGDPLVLCFVDFQSPAHAATAMDAVQGYKFDEHDDETARLRIQFARHPGARSGGGHRGKR